MIVVASSIVGALWFVDHVHREQHLQSSLGGWMSLAKRTISSQTHSLHDVSQILGLSLNREPVEDSGLTFIQKQRVISGQTVVLKNDGRLYVYSLFDPMQHQGGRSELLWFSLDKLTPEHIEGMFNLLSQMAPVPPQEFAAFMAHINGLISIPIQYRPANHESDLVGVAPKHRMEFHMDGRGPTFVSFFKDQQMLVEMGPLEYTGKLSFQTIFVALLFAIILAGISVYWLVQKFEIGLQRLERASSRVASGHLNSRVKVSSQDSIGRLGLAFNRMAEQIQRLMGVQKEMIRAVSHELRTPVARMRFGVQMLEDTVEDGYVQKQLNDMDQDLQELDELVDEILTYARLEEGGPILEFKAANLLELIQQIQEETKRRTDKVEVTCHSEHINENEIFSDIEFRYMHRAVQNLVGNACRYAKDKVHIEYSFKDDICRIDVEDDGDGIPEKDWDRVFSPFTRLDDSRTRSSGGYGLGLSIVRRIIYWHEGRAQVSKSRWGGAKMSLIWPKKMH